MRRPREQQPRHFNPRSREGSDRAWRRSTAGTSKISIHAPVKGATTKITDASGKVLWISIHAPVKGATLSAFPNLLSPNNFNPRSREGSDATNTRAGHGVLIFQSTLP